MDKFIIKKSVGGNYLRQKKKGKTEWNVKKKKTRLVAVVLILRAVIEEFVAIV